MTTAPLQHSPPLPSVEPPDWVRQQASSPHNFSGDSIQNERWPQQRQQSRASRQHPPSTFPHIPRRPSLTPTSSPSALPHSDYHSTRHQAYLAYPYNTPHAYPASQIPYLASQLAQSFPDKSPSAQAMPPSPSRPVLASTSPASSTPPASTSSPARTIPGAAENSAQNGDCAHATGAPNLTTPASRPSSGPVRSSSSIKPSALVSRRRGAAHATPPPAASAQRPPIPKVPRSWWLQQMHEYAPKFYGNTRSCDIRLVIPHATRPGAPPPSGQVPSYPAHRDFLMARSSLFRAVLGSRLPVGTPVLKGCTRLPKTSLHGPEPILVPLPDPASFVVLFDWMYFGRDEAILAALTGGKFNWRGLVQNIEYLGLDDGARNVVANWYRSWRDTERSAERSVRRDAAHAAGEDESEDDSDGTEGAEDDARDDAESLWCAATAVANEADEVARRLGGL